MITKKSKDVFTIFFYNFILILIFNFNYSNDLLKRDLNNFFKLSARNIIPIRFFILAANIDKAHKKFVYDLEEELSSNLMKNLILEKKDEIFKVSFFVTVLMEIEILSLFQYKIRNYLQSDMEKFKQFFPTKNEIKIRNINFLSAGLLFNYLKNLDEKKY